MQNRQEKFAEKKKFFEQTFLVWAALILLIPACVLILWHWMNQVPSGHDSHYHLKTTIQMFYGISGGFSTISHLLTELPARYPPLLFFISSIHSAILGIRYESIMLTILLFWVLSLAVLVLWGKRLTGKVPNALFPVLVALACPVFWEIGFSFNLEVGLFLSAFVNLYLLFFPEVLNKKTKWVWAGIVVFFLSFSKAVLPLFFFVPGLFFVIWGEKSKRKSRIFILILSTLAVLIWLILHHQSITRELMWDVHNPIAQHPNWYFYFPHLFLVRYTGLPLLLLLVVSIFMRRKKDRIHREDIFFLLVFLVPLVFYSAIETKREWYTLVSHIALALWFLHSINQLDSPKLQKWLTRIGFGFYLLAASLLTAGIIGSALAPESPWAYLYRTRPPNPPPAIARQIVNAVIEDFREHPEYRICLDVSSSTLDQYQLNALFLIAHPSLALKKQLFIFDATGINLEEFIDTLPGYTRLYSLQAGWPTVPKAIFEKLQWDMDPDKSNLKLTEIKNHFRRLPDIKLQDGIIALFENRNPDATFFVSCLLDEKGLKDIFFVQPSNIDEAIQAANQAAEQKHFAKAIQILRQVVLLSPENLQATHLLAVNLARAGQSKESIAQWTTLLKNPKTTFGLTIEILRAAASAEREKLVLPGTFESIFDLASNREHLNKKEQYSLLSTKVWACKELSRFQEALTTVTQLKEVMNSEQKNGIDLEEAQINYRLGNLEKAQSILATLSSQPNTDPSTKLESQMTYCRVTVDLGQLKKAQNIIRQALPNEKLNTNYFSLTALYLTAAMKKENQFNEAISLLTELVTNISGESAALMYIDMADLHHSMGDTKAQVQNLNSAGKFTKNEKTLQWIEETLNDLKP